jgi:DNA-binding MarR family transcriptional regulator
MTQGAKNEPAAFTGFLIRRAQQTHVAVWSREVDQAVTSVQFGVLSLLAANPGISQRELCDELDLDRSTIATLVARLERHQLIERERDSGDRRRNRLMLTESGHSEYRRLRPRIDNVERVLTAGMTDCEHREFRRLIGIVLSGAEPSATNTKGPNAH